VILMSLRASKDPVRAALSAARRQLLAARRAASKNDPRRVNGWRWQAGEVQRLAEELVKFLGEQ
jgi:hypothetical protein